MSKIVFSLTEPQVAVLVRIKKGEELTWRDGNTPHVLAQRGLLVQGHSYRDYTLTQLGKLAAELAVALAPAKPPKK